MIGGSKEILHCKGLLVTYNMNSAETAMHEMDNEL